MSSDVLRLSVILPDGEPPSEFRIFATGMTDTCYGPYLFDAISAAMVMKAYADQGNELMVDYEHKSLDPWAPAGAGKAAGWYRLELRGSECWAVDVRWTPDAAAGLLNREWRYFSPAVVLDRESGRIEALINVALTNMPATMRMDPLMASRALSRVASESSPRDTSMSNVAILALLGLGASASEKEIADEVTTLNASASRAKETERALFGATGADSVDKAIGIVLGWKSGAEQVPTLTARVAELEAECERSDRETLLSQHAQKFTPALKQWAQTQTLDALKGFVASAPDIPGLAPSRVRANEATETNESAAVLQGKAWEQLTPSEKHNLFVENRVLYDALKADYQRRGAPRLEQRTTA